ncbi:MAG: type IV pilin protein [Patescibacteria group bacterium]
MYFSKYKLFIIILEKKFLFYDFFYLNNREKYLQNIINMKKQNFLAFTLVELIVVITVLAILSAVAFVSYS